MDDEQPPSALKHPLIMKRNDVDSICSCQQDAEHIRALLVSLERHTIGARRAIDELSEIARRWKAAA